MPPTKPKYKSARSLAKALGTHHSNLPIWADKYPEARAFGLDREKWEQLMLEKRLGEGNVISPDREHSLARAAEYRANLLEIEQQRARGEIVAVSDLEARDRRVALAQRTALFEILTTELPAKSAGKDAGEIRLLNREAANRICAIMQQKLNEWVVSHEE